MDACPRPGRLESGHGYVVFGAERRHIFQIGANGDANGRCAEDKWPQSDQWSVAAYDIR
jgi:hypothetical protein